MQCSPNDCKINSRWQCSLMDVKMRRHWHSLPFCDNLHYTKYERCKSIKQGDLCFYVSMIMTSKRFSKVSKAIILQLKTKFQALADLDVAENNIDEGMDKKWDKAVAMHAQSCEVCIDH